MPKLLDVLHLEGCIVTLDATGCQQAIVEAITDAEADYVLALKGSQEALRARCAPSGGKRRRRDEGQKATRRVGSPNYLERVLQHLGI